jgi:hypothetical protein
MHPNDHRAQYAEGLERNRAARSAGPASRGARELVKIIRDASADGADRLAAIREASNFDPLSKPSVIKAWLHVLSSPEEPPISGWLR